MAGARPGDPRLPTSPPRLAEVSLREVLLRGIHPWQGPYAQRTLSEGFCQRLNAQELKPHNLESHGYAWDLHPTSTYSYRRSSPFQELLGKVGEQVLFVEEGFAYEDLLGLAMGRLSRRWCHRTVRGLLHAMPLSFQELRRFLKSRDPHVKLRGYADLERYDLSGILSLEDFRGHVDLLIRQAYRGLNLRKAGFLDAVTDKGGYLRMVREITHFQARVMQKSGVRPSEALLYNCRREGERVTLIPHLGAGTPLARELARRTAVEWSQGESRYCFQLTPDALEAMLEDARARIDFSTLSYTAPQSPPVSEAKVCEVSLPLYRVGGHLTHRDTVDFMREALRAYGVSTSGNKAQLIEELGELCARVYEEREAELDAYFAAHRFLRTGGRDGRPSRGFPVLEGCQIKGMVLSMYLLRHLRGDAILEAQYVDDTYDPLALARAFLEERVRLEGAFLSVVEGGDNGAFQQTGEEVSVRI